MAMGMKPYVFESLIKYLILIIFVNNRNVMNGNFNCSSVSLDLEGICVSVKNEQALDHVNIPCFYLIHVLESEDMEISAVHCVVNQDI